MNVPTSFSERLQLLLEFLTQPDAAGYAIAVVSDERLLPHLTEYLIVSAEETYCLLTEVDLSLQQAEPILSKLKRNPALADGLIVSELGDSLQSEDKTAQDEFWQAHAELLNLKRPLLFLLKKEHEGLLIAKNPALEAHLAFPLVKLEERLEAIDLDYLAGSREEWEEGGEEEEVDEEMSAEEAQIMATHEFLTDQILPKAQEAVGQHQPKAAWEILRPYLQALLSQTAANPLAQVGELLLQIDKPHLAQQAYTNALAQLSPGRPAKEAEILRQLGQIERQLGDPATAEDKLKAAWKLLRIEVKKGRRPQRVTELALTHEQLGLLYQGQDRLSQARDHYQQAVQLLQEGTPSGEFLQRIQARLAEVD